ncbi:MAG TPA: FMN-binding protein [Gaiellaceae bacterium]
MKKTLAALLGASSVAAPLTGGALAATRAHTVAKTTTKKLTGTDAVAGRWGDVQVVLTAKLTGTGKQLKVRFTDLGGHYDYHTSRSQYIMSQSLPLLRQEFLKAQNANIQMVSGATDTSEAFQQSLQAALHKLNA